MKKNIVELELDKELALYPFIIVFITWIQYFVSSLVIQKRVLKNNWPWKQYSWVVAKVTFIGKLRTPNI